MTTSFMLSAVDLVFSGDLSFVVPELADLEGYPETGALRTAPDFIQVTSLVETGTFPNDGYENFVKQNVPRWTTTDAPIIAAYTALVDKVCPCVVLVHSQAGQFGFKVAQARPDKVKALILVEPAGVGDPQEVAKLKDVPMLAVYGDFIADDARWPTIKANGLKFLDAAKAQGASYDVLDLPAVGQRGNSHMLMMDKNNADVAALIQDWLVKKGLYQ